MKKIISVILTFSLLAALLPILATEANAYSENIIKVGLYYGSSAMPSANLANEVGDGYNFGWFDSNREFYYIGYTYENKITTMKDTNMYLSGGTYYDSMAPAGYTTIGAYHVDIGESYGTYDDALYAAYDIESETGVNAFPAYINGDYRVRAGSYSSKSSAENAALDLGFSAGFVVGNSSTCYTVTVTSTGEIIFEFDNGSPFGIQPTGTEDTITWFKGYKYRGAFEYNRRNGGDVTVINVVGLTDYVKGVIPYEMNPNWHIECLKAHAVCAASFAVAHKNKHSSYGFDVCNTTDCQVYRGTNTATANSDMAAEAVSGLVLYSEGELCDAVYHSSNGGATESAVNVWTMDVPYLQAVKDNFEDLSKATYGTWSYTVTGDQLASAINKKGYSMGTIVDAYVSKYTAVGNVYTVRFVDINGKVLEFSKEAARTILYGTYVHSQRYSILGGSGGSFVSGELYVNDAGTFVDPAGAYVIGADGQVEIISDDIYIASSGGVSQFQSTGTGDSSSNTGSFTIKGSGYGHNVGMSQWGSKGMAEQGYTYDEILSFYFYGSYIDTIY